MVHRILPPPPPPLLLSSGRRQSSRKMIYVKRLYSVWNRSSCACASVSRRKARTTSNSQRDWKSLESRKIQRAETRRFLPLPLRRLRNVHARKKSPNPSMENPMVRLRTMKTTMVIVNQSCDVSLLRKMWNALRRRYGSRNLSRVFSSII